MAHPRAGQQSYVTIGGKNYPTIVDEMGVVRFVADPVIRFAVDSGLLDLNKLEIAFHEGIFPQEDYLRFFVQTGYPVYALIHLPQFVTLEVDNID